MSYKTILVHVDQSHHLAQRVQLAASLALADEAHLVGVALTGVSRFVYEAGTINFKDPGLAHHLEFLRARANTALDQFEALARQQGVQSVERRLVDDEAGGGISMQARYGDLVVIGQTDAGEPSPSVMPDFPEYVLINCGRPVLVVPYAGRVAPAPARVLVAWDASAEAGRAISGALPLLRRAARVDVVVFNAGLQDDRHGEQPGADIALYLARHGITVEVAQAGTGIDTGNALLSLAADLSSDLLVMGGYGHSRFREILLGGTTRTVLESMTLPVLMAH